MSRYDVIVIGAGQAGLATGYFLKKTELSFLILDKGTEAGEVWSNRYDSLVLFTPRFFSSLPGLALDGSQDHFPTKQEIADYLKTYADHFDLPIRYRTEVFSLFTQGTTYVLQTSQGEFRANQIIIATGSFQQPYIPPIAARVDNTIYQTHSALYRNPRQLNNGDALVIGSGNSGAQIAVELAKERKVYFSIGHTLRFLPLQVLGKSIFWWFDKFGMLDAHAHTRVGQYLYRQPDPIFGMDLKKLIKQRQIIVKPRTLGISGNEVCFADHTSIKVPNIVWATGFQPDYSWIQLKSILDEQGKPVHQRGVTGISGLYFVGLPWQSSRASALIGGVGKDAQYIVEHVRQLSGKTRRSVNKA